MGIHLGNDRNVVKGRILIIENDENLSEVLKVFFRAMDCRVKIATDISEAAEQMRTSQWELCFCNAGLWASERQTTDILSLASSLPQPVPVVMLAQYGEMALADEGMSRGAIAKLAKPIKMSDMQHLTRQILEKSSAERATSVSTPAPASSTSPDAPRLHFGTLVGEDPKMQEVYRQIEGIAPTEMTVLVRGESGTGKELVARAIHKCSPRAAAPFVAVNCAAIPANLLESELFGHVKGAFTGAVRNKEGLFKAADGGTLFLDEVGSIPVSMQLSLLRVLQEHEIRPVGGVASFRVDVRVIAATNEDLEKLMHERLFREDLFYRLSVFPIRLPALRERPSDIPLLARHLLAPRGNDGEVSPATLSEEALSCLSHYGWPGNVRELENVLLRADTMAGGNPHRIDAQDLPEEIRRLQPTPVAPTAPMASPLPPSASVGAGMTLKAYLRHCEREYIRKVYSDCGGNKEESARILGVSLATFYRKFEEI